MDGENRIPPATIAAIVIAILAAGIAAYYMGRFGRSSQQPSAVVELPPVAAPAPEVVEMVATPAEVPPTITPPIPVVVEKGGQSSRVLVERSSQIVVPVAPAAPAAAPLEPERTPTERPRIVIEVRPTATPTVPELDEPPPFETPLPPPPPPIPEETPEPEPEPEPEPTPRARDDRVAIGSAIRRTAATAVPAERFSEAGGCRGWMEWRRARRSKHPSCGGADRPIGC
jgi:hypothetical protein